MSFYFVFLRRPGRLDDRRSDPFWEFGSFGRTGCHSRNLLNPSSRPLQVGDRLAFLQGGDGEIRVVGLTPPITMIKIHVSTKAVPPKEIMEVLWDKGYCPISYTNAPLLVSNKGHSDFPAVMDLIHGTNRETFVAAAASRFRSRTEALPEELSGQLDAWFSRGDLSAAECYIDCVSHNRTAWYRGAKEMGWADGKVRQRDYEYLVGNLADSKGVSQGLRGCSVGNSCGSVRKQASGPGGGCRARVKKPKQNST